MSSPTNTRTVAARTAEVARLREMHGAAAPGSVGALALARAERALLDAEMSQDPNARHVDRPRRPRA